MTATLRPTYALVDGNNFYVSCERLFDPRLEQKPVIVMSNNDGMAISRSQEVKALGVKMGAPMHHLRDVIRKHSITTLSSNYALYGDLSQRGRREKVSPAFTTQWTELPVARA